MGGSGKRMLGRASTWVVVLAVALVACASYAAVVTFANRPDEAAPNGPVHLVVDTYAGAGYDALIAGYERAHPDVSVELRVVTDLDRYRADLVSRQAAGIGLGDIVALDLAALTKATAAPINWVGIR